MLLQSLLRPVLTPIMRGIFDPAQSVSAAWSPLALWPDGILSPGMWISPSTLPASFNDYLGTTPVATPGTVADSVNPVGLALDIRAGATTVSDPGNHMLQATSAARPLLSAYDGQTLGPGDTYPSTGFPIYQQYDGTDDGMATASFAAGTLSNAMDCMIAVRRDSGAGCVLFGTLAGFGYFESGGWGASAQGCGTPTALVDGVQVAGGTGVTGTELFSALTVGDWHIFEAQNLDLSSWTALTFSEFSGHRLNGARGDIMLYPSTASTADKDKARQYLANKYGVTLP